jgi:alpha-D-ribose 1-methylphosphonate 5-triphosphate diphosphatase PhnM
MIRCKNNHFVHLHQSPDIIEAAKAFPDYQAVLNLQILQMQMDTEYGQRQWNLP